MRDGHAGGEQIRMHEGQMAQPFAMVSDNHVSRNQDVPNESQTRGHVVRIVR